MRFILFLDEVGAEYARARLTHKEMVAAYRGRRICDRPLSVRPLAVFQPAGKSRLAARGFLLAGADGAALGVLLGKGPAVRFELEFADGPRQGVISQKRYPRFKGKVERMQYYRRGDLAKAVVGTGVLVVIAAATWGWLGLPIAAVAALVAERVVYGYRQRVALGTERDGAVTP